MNGPGALPRQHRFDLGQPALQRGHAPFEFLGSHGAGKLTRIASSPIDLATAGQFLDRNLQLRLYVAAFAAGFISERNF